MELRSTFHAALCVCTSYHTMCVIDATNAGVTAWNSEAAAGYDGVQKPK